MLLRPWIEAVGSGVGAGGMGVASPPAGAAPASAGAAPVPQPPAPQPPQQLCWPQQLLWCFLKRLRRKPQRFFLQQLSQGLPQLGCSQQAGSQQAACSQQAGSAQAGSQQVCSQQLCLWQPPNRPFMWPNRPLRCPQPPPHESQQEGCSQQAGSQQAGSQQAGSQQVGSQQLVSQHCDWQQPPLFRPSIRFSRSKPKLWLQRPKLTTSAPKNMFHFIEQRLLYMELGRNACLATRDSLRHHSLNSVGVLPVRGALCRGQLVGVSVSQS